MSSRKIVPKVEPPGRRGDVLGYAFNVKVPKTSKNTISLKRQIFRINHDYF